ncbi:DNA polymerase III, alpha subunit, partial [Gilliamella apicola SCGC AB-598-I20]
MLTLDDRSGRIDGLLFSDALEKFGHLLVKDKILIGSGQVSHDDFNGGFKLSVRDIVDLKDARAKYVKGLAITLTDVEVNRANLQRLQQIIEPYRHGSVPINLYYHREDSVVRLQFGTTWRIVPEDALIIELKTLLGNDRVDFKFQKIIHNAYDCLLYYL